jgi:hypothetical protein
MTMIASDGADDLVVEGAGNPGAVLAALRAAGVTGAADFAAKLDAAHDAVQAATTPVGVLPGLKVIVRVLYLMAKHGAFRLR